LANVSKNTKGTSLGRKTCYDIGP